MPTTACPECSHDSDDHMSDGCSRAGCLCPLDQRGRKLTPGAKRPKAVTLVDRVERLAERSRPNGPALREVADELAELLEQMQSAVEAAEQMVDAADSYENAEEGRDGRDEREQAWEEALGAAEDLASALNEVEATLTASVGR